MWAEPHSAEDKLCDSTIRNTEAGILRYVGYRCEISTIGSYSDPISTKEEFLRGKISRIGGAKLC